MKTELKKLISIKLLKWSFKIMPNCKFKNKLAILIINDLLNEMN